MKINIPLLNKQIKTLSAQLNKKLSKKERSHIEGLLNMLGDIADERNGIPSPKILVRVEGGNVTSVCSNRKDVKIVIVDYDKSDNGDNPVTDILPPDSVSDNMYELFTDQSDPKSGEVRDELKRRKF